MGYKINNKKGFSLIEITVSMAIFFIVFVLALNTFFYVNKLQKKMLVFYNVENNFQSSLYKMMNDMENSLIDFTWYTDTLDDTNPLQEIHLVNTDEDKLIYRKNGLNMEFDPDGEAGPISPMTLNNGDTEIERLDFYINVMRIGTTDNKLALITTVISGKFTDELNEKSDFNYQFTIEQVIDPYYMGTKSGYCAVNNSTGIWGSASCDDEIEFGTGIKYKYYVCVDHEKVPSPDYDRCLVNTCELGYYKNTIDNICSPCECSEDNLRHLADNSLLWNPVASDEDQRWCFMGCQEFSCDRLTEYDVFLIRDGLEVGHTTNYSGLADLIDESLSGDKIYVGPGVYQFAGGDFNTGNKAIDLIVCQDATIQSE